MEPRDLSVIVSSYNQPRSLGLVLAGFAAQTDTDVALVVADDGSPAETRELVEEFSRQAPFPVSFITQDHRQFGKSEILNRAVLASSGERLLFTDGDCVPFTNLVAVHKRYLRPGRFCVGGYVRLNAAESLSLSCEAVTRGEHERLMALRHKRYLYRIHVKNLFYRLVRKPYSPQILGGNFSVCRDAFYAVNGFDERYEGGGGEDSDIRNRLRNRGYAGVSLWNRAFTCHLSHRSEPSRREQPFGRQRRDRSLYYASRGNLRAVKGLDRHSTGRDLPPHQ